MNALRVDLGARVKTWDCRYGEVVGKATWVRDASVWVYEGRTFVSARGPWMVRINGFSTGYAADDLTVVTR